MAEYVIEKSVTILLTAGELSQLWSVLYENDLESDLSFANIWNTINGARVELG